ncbi:MAG: hypothetical protein HS108_05025 [Planctomycetes bacterium]|jgi:hypothetical protein|nr:hypothetical protein [Planctomycetota bacterium]MCL4729282.1 hypothetical protein [Planctomycetota bacterium]
MKQRLVLFVLIPLLAIAAGVLLYFVAFRPRGAGNGAGNTPPEVVGKPFDKDSFFAEFDLNGDHAVSFEEFDRVYSTWGQEKRFSRGPGQPALASREAFDFFDRNGDGAIDAEDVRFAWDQAWLDFAAGARARGLIPRDWKGRWLALNKQQDEALGKEKGALARRELPFAGAFFDARYLVEGRWARLTKDDGESVDGFVSEKDGRLWLVSPDARLLVFKPGTVHVSELPDSPHNEYVRAVREVTFDDTEANLKLARRCVQWGLKREAGALYARVLIFDRANAEALEALQLRLEGDSYLPR